MYDAWGDLIGDLDCQGQSEQTQSDDANANGGGPTITGLTADAAIGYKAQYGYLSNPYTGLIVCGQRQYNPLERRWMNRDLIGYGGGMNMYAYCDGDPVNGVDPDGTQTLWQSICAGFHKAVFGTVKLNQPAIGDPDDSSGTEALDSDDAASQGQIKSNPALATTRLTRRETNVTQTLSNIGGAGFPGGDGAEIV